MANEELLLYFVLLVLIIFGLPIVFYLLRKTRSGEWQRPRGRAKVEEPTGPLPPPFAPAAFPFDGEVRLVHADYGRLRTGWWKVTVDTPEAWQEKVGQMHDAFQSHFGDYVTRAGDHVPRWSDRTWERVRARLLVEKK